MSNPCQSGLVAHHCSSVRGIRMLSIVLLAGLILLGFLGCAAEEKKPRTVNEWLQQPRVGDSP